MVKIDRALTLLLGVLLLLSAMQVVQASHKYESAIHQSLCRIESKVNHIDETTTDIRGCINVHLSENAVDAINQEIARRNK